MLNKTTKTLLVLLIILVTISCKKDEPSVNAESTYLVGTWVNPQYSDSLFTLERSPNLVDTVYGISFKSDGKLIEHKNIGWCGTPPISYGDYEGNWSEKDSVVNIEVGFWGGTAILQWKLLSITNDHITIHQLSAEYIEE